MTTNTPSPLRSPAQTDASGLVALAAELRGLMAKAASPPLAVEPDMRPGMAWNDHIVFDADPNMRVAFMVNGKLSNARSALIVAAVNALPVLLDAIDTRPTSTSAGEVRQLIERCAEELRLIRMKDTGAVYDIGLRTDLSAYLSAPPASAGEVREAIARVIRAKSRGGCEVVEYHKIYAVREDFALEIADAILALVSTTPDQSAPSLPASGEWLGAFREELRLVGIARPPETPERDTYGDGFTNAIWHVVGLIDRKVAALGDQP